jgi:hypothetical protein
LKRKFKELGLGFAVACRDGGGGRGAERGFQFYYFEFLSVREIWGGLVFIGRSNKSLNDGVGTNHWQRELLL